MNFYLYDGSFDGLLTSIYEAYYREKKPDKIIKKSQYQKNLFADIYNIRTDNKKASKVAKAIKNKISSYSFKNIYYCYLSEENGVENDIYYYLKIAFREGRSIEKNWTDDRVLRIKKLSKKVARERHKFLGLLRFRRLKEGILYAPFEPDYNILPIISNHFASRMKNMKWVIHDKKRELAVIYDKKEWLMIDAKELPKIYFANDENFYQSLWKQFFESITIENRKNLKLQSNFMPKKYWKYLVEK